jgi:Protein of unknown function (DUF1153)
MRDPTPTSRRYVIGPDGTPLSMSNLPRPDTRRWVARRKAEVIYAVRGGLLTIEEACERYILSLEEFMDWQGAVTNHGLNGLRTTRVQDYRKNNAR